MTGHQIAPTTIAWASSHGPARGVDAAASMRDHGAGQPAAGPRSAHPNPAFAGAVKTMADHGRIVAASAAGGDRARARELLVRQGEILMAAGMQLILEGGAS